MNNKITVVLLVFTLTILLSGCISTNSNDKPKVSPHIELPNNGTVVLYFYTDWCGYCKKLEPTIEKLKEKGVIIKKINGDNNRDLVSKYYIRGYPTIIYIKNYTEINRTIGYNPVEIQQKSLELFNIE